MTRFVLLFVALLAPAVLEAQGPIRDVWPSTPLLENATTVSSGTRQRPATRNRTFQAYGETSAGAGAATIVIEVSNVEEPGANDWITAGTINLTLATTRTTDGFTMQAAWRNVRARVSAISGTNATVTVRMGN